MSIVIRTFEEMVEAIIARIVAADVGLVDGPVLRTLVESIVAEMDIQYYQLSNIDEANDPELASGEDLDKLISVLGITRNQATKATATVRFQRTTPAQYDIPIPLGTVISTRKDIDGNVIEFITTQNGTLATGDTYVDIPVEAIVAGYIPLIIGQITVMSDPIIGIDSVTNTDVTNNGTDEETDEQLRDRSSIALDGLGKATDNALQSALLAIPGVLEVTVLDQNRGVGTSDVLVVTSTMPTPQLLLDQIDATIADTKASGISVQRVTTNIKAVNVTITLIGTSDVDTAGNAILSYMGQLVTGQTLIINQMERFVLNAFNVSTIDVNTTLPADNVTCLQTEAIRAGVITINGVIWNG